MDPEARAITDGGGLASAAVEPLRGPRAIARFFVAVLDRQPDLAVREAVVNGEPGLVATAGGQTLAVVALAPADGRILRIWAVRNPQKLGAWR